MINTNTGRCSRRGIEGDAATTHHKGDSTLSSFAIGCLEQKYINFLSLDLQSNKRSTGHSPPATLTYGLAVAAFEAEDLAVESYMTEISQSSKTY